MVFFFFKQKTAYEMRISDWSSDVCSSDLLEQPAGDMFEAFCQLDPLDQKHALPLKGAQLHVALRHVRGDRQPGRNGLGLGGSDLLARQIGRAACRDRVCQYV